MTVFGTTQDGTPVHVLTLTSDDLTVRVLTLGAILNDLRLTGVDDPLTLGSPDVAAYEGPLASFGSVIGPVVGRIQGASFKMDGKTYKTDATAGADTLHSGPTGIQHQVWQVAKHSLDTAALWITVPDGQGGLPGTKEIQATYTLDGPALTLTLTATTDKTTPINLANHSYWSLGGSGFKGHHFQVNADHYLPAGPTLLPTGEIAPVDGTRFDLRAGHILAGDASEFWDHNLCTAPSPQPLRDVATLTGPAARMTLASTQPGLQIFDCGSIDGRPFATHHGAPYGPYAGLALEAQHWPGALHNFAFPTFVQHPTEIYQHITRWTFTAT